MDLSPDGVTLRVETPNDGMFEAEKEGRKMNVDLLATLDEYHELLQKAPEKIIVSHNYELFLREISNICLIGSISGKQIVNVSWKQSTAATEYVPTAENQDPNQPDSYAHSFETEGTYILIPITIKLRDQLDANKAYLSYNRYISDLLLFYTDPPHTVSREV